MNAKKVRQLRWFMLNSGWIYSEIADVLGLSTSEVYSFCRGYTDAPDDVIEKLSEFYDVDTLTGREAKWKEYAYLHRQMKSSVSYTARVSGVDQWYARQCLRREAVPTMEMIKRLRHDNLMFRETE